jgi:hypothetical protein
MLKRDHRRKFGKVTWDGRVVVDVDQLYRSKQVRDSMNTLDAKIVKGVAVPDSTLAFHRPLTTK